MKRWWVRWYNCYAEMGPFTLYTPWWESGFTMDEPERQIMVAAVKAPDEERVKEIIYGCYDKRPDDIEFSFINERTPDWDPYCDRFEADDWMEACWARDEYQQVGLGKGDCDE